MTTVRRALRSPWPWMALGLIMAFLPQVVFLVYLLLWYAALMFFAVRKYHRDWKRTGQINHRWFTVRRRWVARVFVGTFAALGAIALILALEAVIVGVPSK